MLKDKTKKIKNGIDKKKTNPYNDSQRKELLISRVDTVR